MGKFAKWIQPNGALGKNKKFAFLAVSFYSGTFRVSE